MENKLEYLPSALLPWYGDNKRDLQWRRDREPYHIWLSEIMLQQTRVEAVKGYYARFLDRLPTIEALANCGDEELHKLWEGLGYYSRVRNLKKAAQDIMSTYDGQFPRQYPQVLALPGIGEYTAGAICSIAFGQPKAAVDGNVLRVLSRIRRDGECVDLPAHKNRVRQELEAVYPKDRPGEFTQALMELGATVCLPNGAPKCESCPCRGFCESRDGAWNRYPVRQAKRQRRQEDKTVFILRCGDVYALEKRPGTGLLAGLWQFPDTAGHLEPEGAIAHLEGLGLRPIQLERMVERSHIFTHIRWDMRGYYITVAEMAGDWTWMDEREIESGAALPTAYRQFWEERGHV